MMAAFPEAISKIVTDNTHSSTEMQLNLMMERGGNVATKTIANTTFDAARRTIEETKMKAEVEVNARADTPRAVVNATAEAERKRLEDIIATLTANITTLRMKAEVEAAESRMSIARSEAQRVEALAVADAERLARVETEARVTAAREEAEEARKIAEIEAAKARAKAVEDEANDPLHLALKGTGWW
jgi:membrane protein involved in colicin uptake